MSDPQQNTKSIWSGRYIPVFALSLLVVLGTYVQSVQWLENRGLDLAAHLLPEQTPGDQVVVIAIDQSALDKHEAWPWPRSVLARAIDRMRKAKVKTIGLLLPLHEAQTPAALKDALLEIEAGKERLENRRDLWQKRANGAEKRRQLEKNEVDLDKLEAASYWLARIDTDKQLAKSIGWAGNVVLAADYAPADHAERSLPTLDKLKLNVQPSQAWYQREWLSLLWRGPTNLNHLQVYPPIPELAQIAAGIGVVPRAGAGHVQGVPLALEVDGQGLTGFAAQVAANALGVKPQDLVTQGRFGIRAGERVFATGPDFIYFPRPLLTRDGEPPVTKYSVNEVLNGKVGAAQLADKVVVLGFTGADLTALYSAPGGAMITPVEWTAHTVAGLLAQEQITQPSWFYALQRLVIIAVALYLLLLPSRFYGSTAGVLITFIVGLLVLNAGLITLIASRVWLPFVLPMLFLLSGYTIMTVRHRVRAAILHGRDEAFEARRLLGINLQAQGQLDQAFSEFKKCDLDHNVLYHLYQLGQDFERRRKFTKALEVYEYMATQAPRYRDIADRLKRLNAVPDSNTARFTSAESLDATLVLDDSAIEKPMLGRYRLEAQVGRGAMGIVYLGVDPKIGRKVAIKTLNLTQEFEGTDLEEVKWRFYREAEASGRLQHKNIVMVYDVGEEHDLAYIAMDFIDGDSLDKFVKEENLLPVSEVLTLGAQVADALDYAHRQQVVHRDIKPANVIYETKTHLVKITDFGIACLTDNSKTRTGTLLGTPAYMSPEQITGDRPDGRSDLYSLGVTLYQMLCGELPFSSDSMANLVFKITSEKPVDIRRIRSDISPDIARVINKCLQKDPSKRYQTGANMALALNKVLASWESGPSDADFL